MEITIPGPPIAKKRPRFARIGKGVRTYSDQQTEEGKFLLLAQQQVTEQMEGPLKVSCCFYMPRPKGHYGTGRNAGKLKASAPRWHTNKPDIDNYIKFLLDCLNGLAWKDDAQIVFLDAIKCYAETPKTVIEVSLYAGG